MIVVADSGPLHYLILLEQVDLLRRFYRQVLVPEAVASELSATGALAITKNGPLLLTKKGPPSERGARH
jgi:predicted nucleic acid-binding protein